MKNKTIYRLQFGESNLNRDIDKMEFNNFNELCETVTEFCEKIGGNEMVFLLRFGDEEEECMEIYVTDDWQYPEKILRKLAWYGFEYPGTFVCNLHFYECYQDAYMTALMMKETSGLAFPK